MLKYFNKEKNMQLDPQVASQMLSNIFDACDIEQNSVPLEVLTSYSNYRKERFLFQKFVLGFLLIVFFLLPILFVAPKFTLEQKDGEISGKPYVELQLKGLMPTDKIEAFMDTAKVPIYEMPNGTYQIIPDRNGTLDVSVYLINKQQATRSFQIKEVDTQPPVLAGIKKTDGNLIIYFEEDSGHLDYENIYAKTINGEIIKPISYDESSLSVTFKYPKEALNLFIPDMSANTLQVAVTLK